MDLTIISTNEATGGTKKQQFEAKNDWDDYLIEQQKRQEKLKYLKEVESQMRPWVETITEAINNKTLFELAEIDKKQLRSFLQTIYNSWLNCFEDCQNKIRSSKFKRTKLQFEKHPRKEVKITMRFKTIWPLGQPSFNQELTEYGEEKQRVQRAIDNLVAAHQQFINNQQ